MTQLFAFGSNGGGQLGIGHMEDTNRPTACIGLPTDDPIVKISGGGNHSAIITKQGHLYMTGSSRHGEESHDDNEEFVNTYKRQLPDIKCRDVACGWAFTIVLTETGKLYGIGTSRWNELGSLSSTDKWTEIRHAVFDNQQIVSIACGWRHCIALDAEGTVYGWGWGRHGQLGPGARDKKDIRAIQRITMPQPIVQAACGHLHTLLRGKDGRVYSFGSNKYGQLGTDDTAEDISTLSVKASWIDAGWHHSAILDESGNLTLFGRNDHGQLTTCTQPIRGIRQFVCGSEHTVAIRDNNNEVIAWGWNEHGNCTSDMDFVSEPISLGGFNGRVNILGAGCATTWLGVII
ncbi:regulator of chromosome condensation 1/beta-lactamase-inhibitor protein II [Cokeromyces recurvatus]|uniref:regulator of chromosome condensation 1/beta-lactamase-inhibitor protein II n=1 Tax=Cokeromyces recurvatus TaxID=90255 RepID=UPI002220F7A5|nr:regulator of chromosome condensation 1/beta-lactamase-inhibitor protein II [Cokeromyces recurvatus]KAI7904222.1 regulator of chromosome condensation 1/beta-lactamase-inhibitor protein II [Cokeromyces recurvatus]